MHFSLKSRCVGDEHSIAACTGEDTVHQTLVCQPECLTDVDEWMNEHQWLRVFTNIFNGLVWKLRLLEVAISPLTWWLLQVKFKLKSFWWRRDPKQCWEESHINFKIKPLGEGIFFSSSESPRSPNECPIISSFILSHYSSLQSSKFGLRSVEVSSLRAFNSIKNGEC